MLNEIKRNNKEDIEEFIKFSNLFFREYYNIAIEKNIIENLISFNTLEVISREIKEGKYKYYLINYEDKNIGSMAIAKNKDYFDISQIYILKKYRKQGFGLKVIKELKTKNKKLQISILEDNKKLPKIIEKWQFVKTGSIARYIGDNIYLYENVYSNCRS